MLPTLILCMWLVIQPGGQDKSCQEWEWEGEGREAALMWTDLGVQVSPVLSHQKSVQPLLPPAAASGGKEQCQTTSSLA